MQTIAPETIARAWEKTSSADRIALVGHDRDELSAHERARFSRLVQEAAADRRR